MAARKGKPAPKGNPNKLGALWLHTSANGVKYMSGEIEGIGRVVVFKNGFKEDDKHPDYVVYLSEERDKKPAKGKEVAKNEEAGNDDIPF